MKINILLAGITALCIASCTHADGPLIGGRGGNVTLNIYPEHHGVSKNIINFTAYIKYNATDAPANGKYDDSIAGVNKDNKVLCTFTGLTRGNYYIAGKGIDTAGQDTVKGGINYYTKEEGPRDVDLHVSED